MFRFTLLGFPVSIHWMFWLTAALLSGQIDNLSKPGALWQMGIWMAVVFLSVLWHELGHVIFQRKFGARPEIMLVAFGGLAVPHGGQFNRGQSFVIAAAGPAFGLLLWGASEIFFHFHSDIRKYCVSPTVRFPKLCGYLKAGKTKLHRFA